MIQLMQEKTRNSKNQSENVHNTSKA